MVKILGFLLIVLLIDMFIGMCIAFIIHHNQSDKPFTFTKETFVFMIKGWPIYLFRLVFKKEEK